MAGFEVAINGRFCVSTEALLPTSLTARLREHLEVARERHERDLALGRRSRRATRRPTGQVPDRTSRMADWVALASLRDGGNAVLDYDSPAVQLGGITLPSSLASWFRAANFAQVENRTNLFFDSDIQTLIQAGARFSSGATVCLFIGANLLSGREGGTAIPDHWVVLTSPIRIGGASMPSLVTMGSKVNGDARLAEAGISFDVFTWGDAGYPVRKRRPHLNVKTCVDFFYGFVAAK